jgi:hypothetical protein
MEIRRLENSPNFNGIFKITDPRYCGRNSNDSFRTFICEIIRETYNGAAELTSPIMKENSVFFEVPDASDQYIKKNLKERGLGLQYEHCQLGNTKIPQGVQCYEFMMGLFSSKK